VDRMNGFAARGMCQAGKPAATYSKGDQIRYVAYTLDERLCDPRSELNRSRITHHGASASNYRSPECQQLAFSTIGINVAQE
jgi:hypothetical protein